MILCGNYEPLQAEDGTSIEMSNTPASGGTGSIVIFGV
jgi:hypothetical protein